MLLLFAAAIFVSSTLVFLVQPMFARMVLPTMGGSPAVWNTAMLFYQGVLLLAYGYAHLMSRWLGSRRLVLVHSALLLLPLLVLPIAVPEGWDSPGSHEPSLWLLALFAWAIFLPFFVVSTTSPLLQRWFSTVGHRDSGDPYFLYVAGNAGSMAALLAYPLILEPAATTVAQGWVWTAGYGAFVLLLWACAAAVRKRGSRPEPAAREEKPAGTAGAPVPAPPGWRSIGLWVALAFVPSSHMLSVTTYISTDVAAAPLLWVIPLSLYLLSFILVFGRRTTRLVPWFNRAFPVAAVAIVMVLGMGSTKPMGLMVFLHLAVFFVVAMTCHGRLAAARPHPAHLTGFYLWMAVGGALGGLFNALAAPMLFTSVAEYPIALVLAVLLHVRRPEAEQEKAAGHLPMILDLVFPAVLGGITLALIAAVASVGLAATAPGLVVCFGLPVFASYFFSARRVRFALALGIILAASAFYGQKEELLHVERTFYGIHRVSRNPESGRHLLAHGRTLHGQQSPEDGLRRIPQAYYHPSGPIGEVFHVYREKPGLRVAAVGLGAGALAAYAQPKQEWTFFELDPAVARIASDPRYFTYLQDARTNIEIRVGDARLELESAGGESFDLIILDAYTSDAIPVHLATREALQVYLSRLSPRGLLAFHVSNQHLNLAPVIGNLARDAGLVCLYRHDQRVTEEQAVQGKEESQWMVLSRYRSDVDGLLALGRWRIERGDSSLRVWTDDYSSILQVLDF